MALRFLTTVLGLLFFMQIGQAQRLEEFSTNTLEFYKQLEDYMTASKRKVMKENVEAFGARFQAGGFSAAEQDTIIATCNRMLQLKMKASPYFKDYLTSLTHIKTLAGSQQRFVEWHEVIHGMLDDMKGRKLKPIENFLEFSSTFFQFYAFQYSDKGGVNWTAMTDSVQLSYKNQQPQVVVNSLNLLATRKSDSLLIENTSGVYYPLDKLWKGKLGRAGWERHDLGRNHYAQFKEYEIEMKGTNYKVPNSILYLPSFFKEEAITGTFEDKLVSGSYKSFPRFTSSKGIIKIEGIGEGIEFYGQFSLEGVNVIGKGTAEHKAKVLISDKKGQVRIVGLAESFTIKKGEVINGQEVKLTLHMDQDSITHPSINFRFDVKERILSLSRGDRSNDRNAFSSSYHQVDIDAEKMIWHVDKDTLLISEEAKAIGSDVDKRIYYESKQYFSSKEYRRLQGVSTVNPITTLKVFSEMEGTRTVDASMYAKRLNPKYSLANIKSLLFDMVSKGYIQYDAESELIEVYDKVFLYSDASRDKVDYDNLRIVSATNETSGILNTEDKGMEINGIKFIEFSSKQQVATQTDSSKILMKGNRDIDFRGKVYASLGVFQGKAFHFDYDKFQIRLDSIDVLELFEKTDDSEGPRAIESRLENLSGVLLIDAPSNKSGKEDIDIFPSFQSQSSSFVYYDNPNHLDSTYNKEDFNFELNDFSLNALDKLGSDDMNFKGKMKSAGIFPEFEETLVLQEDKSLGFTTQTPDNGYQIYGGKGTYRGDITLNNSGFTGVGKLNYLSAEINSEDFEFMPNLMTASADQFNLIENKGRQIPQIEGLDIKIAWKPYSDSLEIRTAGDPFKIYQKGNFDFSGTTVLTPEGLRGSGKLEWEKAEVNSEYFNFGSNSARSDTMGINIRAIDADDFVISTNNLKGSLDFDQQIGKFKSNLDTSYTTLPYNQYVTTMTEFTWNIEQEDISFVAGNQLADFISIHPNQDSLIFSGRTAYYNIKESKLNITGVPFIRSCDAFIYPESGLVFIEPGGAMSSFKNGKIIADTANQNHIINRANITVNGRKDYTADGYYEYNIGPHQQEIFLSDIIGSRIGKGKKSEKATETRAKGAISPEETFYIDHKTQFRGDISLQSSKVNLQFKGYAKLDAPKLGNPEWFTIDSEGDKKDLMIGYDLPRSYAGDKLYTGFYLSKENTRIYPRVFMPLYFRKDRPILPVKGVFKFDEKKDEFVFGDSTKIVQNLSRGNYLTFNNKTGIVKGEGLLNVCSELDYVKVKAAGTIESVYPNTQDSTTLNPTVFANMMAAIDMIVPEPCLRMLINDIQSSSFDAKDVIYVLKEPFYRAALAEFIRDTTQLSATVELMKTRTLTMPKGYPKNTFFFSDLPMKWDPDYQSFVTSKAKSGLAGINGTMLNKMIECYVEFKMPGNLEDRVYIYIKSPSGYFYFFSYKGGIMGAVSDNSRFNDVLRNLKGKEAIRKMKDGGRYEIQNLEPNTASRFLARAKAAMED